MSPAGRRGSWFLLALAGTFVGLGILFVAAPRLGAGLFGLPPPEGPALAYLVAIGLRDLAFGLYIAILSRRAAWPLLGMVLAATLVIPLGDLLILAAVRGLESPAHLLLHGASGLVLAGTALWLLRQPDSSREPSG